MAKLNDKGNRRSGEAAKPEELLATLNNFVGTCRAPAALEYGEEVMPLRTGEYALELRNGRVWIEVWHENRTLSRRILAVESVRPGLAECAIQRFGGVTGKLSLLDLERPQTGHRTLAGTRQSFGEQFRRMLFRQFPGWRISSLSSQMDLQRSFSPVFPRARLSKGDQQIAAIACPNAKSEAALMTFALLWFDYLSAAGQTAGLRTRLCLFLPEDAGTLSAHRLHWLDRNTLRAQLFRFNGYGSAGEVDPADLGNLDTRVSDRYVPLFLPAELELLLGKLKKQDGIGFCPELKGALSIRLCGKEFARVEKERVFLGMESKEEIAPGDYSRIERYAEQLASLINSGSRHQGLFPGESESWLESQVRANLTAVDPCLLASPLHGQVLTFAAGDRDLVDLLAVNPAGRLTVMELKTSEDIHLPLQALDYWMRVVWHRQRGELSHLFPQLALSAAAPGLVLLAPAISFHSSNATVLRYFSPSIDVERVGINSDWKHDFKVVLRLKGAEMPQSHGSAYECSRSAAHQESRLESES